MTEFRSRIDLWLLAIILPSVLIALGASAFTLLQGGAVAYVISLFVFVLGVGLPAWIFLGTKYVVASSVLNVRCGPFSWSIPVSSIHSTEETRDAQSSPALSLDRIAIHYGSGKSLMVSPSDKHAFLIAIEQAQN